MSTTIIKTLDIQLPTKLELLMVSNTS